jgi:hypothetical protein
MLKQECSFRSSGYMGWKDYHERRVGRDVEGGTLIYFKVPTQAETIAATYVFLYYSSIIILTFHKM